MTVYALNIFTLAAESGSFIKAASELNLTPSAVSHAIVNLEKEFGYRIPAEEEMREEILRAGESDLVDVLVHLVLSHADAVVCKADTLLVGADAHPDRVLFSLRLAEIADQCKLLQLRDRIASVGHHFTHENIVVRIEPFLYDRKNLVAVDGKIAAFCRHIKSPLVFLSLKLIIVQIEQKSTKN